MSSAIFSSTLSDFFSAAASSLRAPFQCQDQLGQLDLEGERIASATSCAPNLTSSLRANAGLMRNCVPFAID
jgi:hypothetical protein